MNYSFAVNSYQNSIHNISKYYVEDIMIKNVITLTPDDYLKKAEFFMKSKNIKHIPVLDEGRLLGLLTDNDILESVCVNLSCFGQCNRQELLNETKIRDVMRGGIITINKDATLEEASNRMIKFKISSLPVVEEDDRLIGLITQSDFLEIIATNGKN